MTDPSKFDDDWAELARELERDKPSSPPPAHERAHSPPPPEPVDHSPLDLNSERIEASITEEFEEVSEGASEGESDSDSEPGSESGSADDQPGTLKKRRRRRRRRRKGGGGQPSDLGPNEDQESEKESAEAESEEPALSTEAGIGETEYAEEEDAAFEPVRQVGSEADEDAGGELLRELIANWNVPSWEDVVSGLYRPER
jgi:ribonuclease E